MKRSYGFLLARLVQKISFAPFVCGLKTPTCSAGFNPQRLKSLLPTFQNIVQ